jgi:hypothetical protein
MRADAGIGKSGRHQDIFPRKQYGRSTCPVETTVKTSQDLKMENIMSGTRSDKSIFKDKGERKEEIDIISHQLMH